MRATSTTRIPNYIASADVKNLRRLMLLNNAKLSGEVIYFDIQNVKGIWYAWFFEDALGVVIDEENKKASR